MYCHRSHGLLVILWSLTPLAIADISLTWHSFSLCLCLDFLPRYILPCQRSNGFIHQTIKATHIHSIQNDIPHHMSDFYCFYEHIHLTEAPLRERTHVGLCFQRFQSIVLGSTDSELTIQQNIMML